jgi:hypothetical protein
MSPKVQQQVARSKTKRRAMAKTESMAKKYYVKVNPVKHLMVLDAHRASLMMLLKQ